MVTGVAEGLILPVKVENLLVQGRERGGGLTASFSQQLQKSGTIARDASSMHRRRESRG